MGNDVNSRVVVLGGSMAGLLAARVLSEHFTEVVLVDRDALIGVTGYRRGVPHGRHAHGLVARGQQILEAQFPGLTEDLGRAGVVSSSEFHEEGGSSLGAEPLAAPSGQASPRDRPPLPARTPGAPPDVPGRGSE